MEGVMFDFPTGAQLQAGAYLIVAKNAQAIRDHYGIENVMGNYEGSLDNKGEILRLVNALGEGVTRFRYGTRGRWPASADGAGDSLVLRQPLLNNDDPESWTHSFLRGGSPGWQEPGSEARSGDEQHREHSQEEHVPDPELVDLAAGVVVQGLQPQLTHVHVDQLHSCQRRGQDQKQGEIVSSLQEFTFARG